MNAETTKTTARRRDPAVVPLGTMAECLTVTAGSEIINMGDLFLEYYQQRGVNNTLDIRKREGAREAQNCLQRLFEFFGSFMLFKWPKRRASADDV